MRGLRPSASANLPTSSVAAPTFADLPHLIPIDARDGADLGLVASVDLLQGIGDLADGGLRAGGVDGERHEVVAKAILPRAVPRVAALSPASGGTPSAG